MSLRSAASFTSALHLPDSAICARAAESGGREALWRRTDHGFFRPAQRHAPLESNAEPTHPAGPSRAESSALELPAALRPGGGEQSKREQGGGASRQRRASRPPAPGCGVPPPGMRRACGAGVGAPARAVRLLAGQPACRRPSPQCFREHWSHFSPFSPGTASKAETDRLQSCKGGPPPQPGPQGPPDLGPTHLAARRVTAARGVPGLVPGWDEDQVGPWLGSRESMMSYRSAAQRAQHALWPVDGASAQHAGQARTPTRPGPHHLGTNGRMACQCSLGAIHQR